MKTGRARAGGTGILWAVLFSLGALTGCDRMITSRQEQLTRDADAKAAAGEYAQAISLYEAALDGTAASAEVHYKLALIYDDQLHDPLNALHHFKRFLALEPSGKRAEDVKRFMKRDELTLVTGLTGDAMVPRSELVRLTNENLNLRKQLGDRWAAQKLAAAAAEKETRAKDQPNDKAKEKSAPRYYKVEPGDTLASIARKFYRSSARWPRILEANKQTISKPSELRPGQTLLIP